MIETQLRILDPETGSYTSIGDPVPGGIGYNAMGYNIEDNYLYAMANGVGVTGNLLRIEDDGSYTNLGLPAGLPAETYVAGDFDQSGNLYVREFDLSSEIWVIDVSANTASVLNLSSSLFVSELVHINGYLYGQQGAGFRRVEIATGTVTASTPSGLSGIIGLEPFGAGWATIDDELFLARNSNGVIYRVDGYTTGSPVFVPVLQGDLPNNNDGASCPNATSPIQELTAMNDSNTLSGPGPLVVSAANGVLQNDMGDTITVTSSTQPANGTVTVNPDGSYTYTPNAGFTGIDSFTYTITDTFGLTATATVTITVSSATVNGADTQTGTLADTGQQQYLFALLAGLLLVTITTSILRMRYARYKYQA